MSDVSSDVAPEELGTAEEFEVAIELETVEADDANEDPTGDVAEEVAEKPRKKPPLRLLPSSKSMRVSPLNQLVKTWPMKHLPL